MLINNTGEVLGEGPNLYAVTVFGPMHQKPTLWLAQAWDGDAAEAFAKEEAGYEEDDDEAFTDSVLVGQVDPVTMKKVMAALEKVPRAPMLTGNQCVAVAARLNETFKS